MSCSWSKFKSSCYCRVGYSSLLSFWEEISFLLLIQKMGLFQSVVMADGKGIMVKMSFCHCARERRGNTGLISKGRHNLRIDLII